MEELNNINETMVNEVTDMVCESDVISGKTGVLKKVGKAAGIVGGIAVTYLVIKKAIVPWFKNRKHKNEEVLVDMPNVDEEYPIEETK